MNTDSFLPEGYEVPSGFSDLAKILPGNNKFAILTKAELGYVYWEEYEVNGEKKKRSVHKRTVAEVNMREDKSEAARHFWAVAVWDYTNQQIKLLEIVQQQVQQQIVDLMRTGWGDPRNYDIDISRKGEGFQTKYNVTPLPRTAMPAEAIEAINSTQIDLNQLFEDNGSVFSSKEPAAQPPVQPVTSGTMQQPAQQPTTAPAQPATSYAPPQTPLSAEEQAEIDEVFGTSTAAPTQPAAQPPVQGQL